jgi:hypothetical protein
VLGTDQGRLVPEATGGLQELALIAAGRLGQNPEALQAYFLGEALKAAQKLFDRTGLIGDLFLNAAVLNAAVLNAAVLNAAVLDAGSFGVRLRLWSVLGIQREGGLRDVEAAVEFVGGIDGLGRVFDLEKLFGG